VPNQYLFGVFDGHGRVGHKVSNFVASQVRVRAHTATGAGGDHGIDHQKN
jgi:serine/threonine protein phosphatase PrpC